MELQDYQTLLHRLDSGVLYVTLNRPKVRNAMNLVMVQELQDLFTCIENNRAIRAVVLSGVKGYFCSGGDIKDMANLRSQVAKEGEDPIQDFNRRFGYMLSQINAAPQAVIALLDGVVLGGGMGLACVSDIAIAKKDCRFGLPETGLGIAPAQIAPFVVQRIGLTQARRLGVLGSVFDGEEALHLGLVHHVCETDQAIQDQLQKTIEQIRRCAPEANSITKKIMLNVGTMDIEQLLDSAAIDFSSCIRGEEGREGTQAFIEKRLPTWAEDKNE